MVIGSVVSEILGGVNPPQMLLHCQKEQMLLTVKGVPDEVDTAIVEECHSVAIHHLTILENGDTEMSRRRKIVT